MQIFRLVADSANVVNLSPKHSSDVSILSCFNGSSISISWHPILFHCSNLPLHGTSFGDCLALATHIPVFSERAVKTLKPSIGQCGEFLPITTDADIGPYYAYNVTNVVNALNLSKSVVKYYKSSGRIMDVPMPVFTTSILEKATIFKDNALSLKDVFVTDVFRMMITKAGLKGFIFHSLECPFSTN